MATKYKSREIPQISLADFDTHIDEITNQLCTTAEQVGFFAIVDHGISPAENPQNTGYEHKSQVCPSTSAADQKESYQLQFGENMRDLWIGDDARPGFKDESLRFMHKLQGMSEKLMVCLTRRLGFPDDFFIKAHDISQPSSQSVLRLLHYFETPKTNDSEIHHRASAHVDWGFLTLLFEREGQSGLEICPGREVVTEWAADDRFKSTFHRVKAPYEEGDNFGERYSITFFNQPHKDTLIQGPNKKYPIVTGEQFTSKAIAIHYAALQAKLNSQQEANEKGTRVESVNTALVVL
ncbi:related to iron/ascorbate family oxidoreductases [Cephalotrichum gorgonifer]|uniref:Related to iron/ascorbate family oxidoreductases n=1 Tax=Cephalotrichum gorgonifer TaxID=2041049 RepID=A0AAE8SZQ8_9PEZI|nr:related to iron/ascorbate family oxidoreductases [Cephalotrichum gorgonifer]